MSMNPNMANREVMDLILLDYQDKTPFLNLDFANVTTTDLAATRVFAKGGRGAPNRVGFDGERTGTLKIDTQITPMKLYAMLSGSEVVKTASWMKRVVKTASNNDSTFTITLDEEPAAGSVSVFAAGDDCGAKVECTVSGSTVTLTGGAAKEYICLLYTSPVFQRNGGSLFQGGSLLSPAFRAFPLLEEEELVSYTEPLYSPRRRMGLGPFLSARLLPSASFPMRGGGSIRKRLSVSPRHLSLIHI